MATTVEEVKMGGSLVSNILKRATALDSIHIEESLQKVQKKCAELKLEVSEFLKQNYDEFVTHADTVISLEQRVEEVKVEFQRLTTRVEIELKGRLAKSIGKREEIEKSYNETEEKIKFVESLVTIHNMIEECKHEIVKEEYSIAANLVKEVSNLIALVGSLGCDAKVYRALKAEIELVKSDLKCQLQEEWNKYIQWRPSVPTQEHDKTMALEVSHTIPYGSAQFESVVQAMKCLFSIQEWEERVKRYGTKLLDVFVKPFLKTGDLKLTLQTKTNSHILGLEMSATTLSIEDILTDILTLVTTVCKMMLEPDQLQWMRLLGETIEPDLSLLLRGLLSQNSPKTVSERENYSKISSVVAEFEEKLRSLGLVHTEYSELTDFTSNVDTHIATQQCQDILGQTRSILMKPLHNTVSASPKDTAHSLKKLNLYVQPNLGSSEPEHLQPAINESDISSLTFVFPECQVSQSVKEFITLLYDTLLKCTTSPARNAALLYYTARDMVELFIAISEAHHKPIVTQLPRLAALQHNNCMFVSHHLVTLGHQFHVKVPATGLTFIDYVPQLRRMGEDCFLSEMEVQSANIVEFLKPVSSFEDIGDNLARQEELDRSIRQSILHIYKLSKIYAEILPLDLQKRCKGGLLNVLVSELISRTLALVDISVSDALFLLNLLQSEVLKKGPVTLSLTQEEENQLSVLCSSWERLKELVFILEAEQHDIVARWNHGEGSLAKEMTVAEVKHLIRALFKNTERRADTLSKITI